MTVEAIEFTAVYTVSGVGPYSIPHGYRSGLDISVSLREGDVWVDLSPLNYTVSPGAADDSGGDVTLLQAAADLHDGKTIRILRSTALEQGWQGQTAREVGLERQLDTIVMGMQDLSQMLQRSLTVVSVPVTFPTLADFQAWVSSGADVNLPDGTVCWAGLAQFEKAAALATPGIVERWVPAGAHVSPFHFGGLPLPTFDSTTALNAAIAFAAASWGVHQAFNWDVDLVCETWHCWGSVNATGIRQPGFRIANGQIHSHAAGKIALDGSLTAKLYLTDVQIYGDKDEKPTVGVYVGRAKLNGKFPQAASMVAEGSTGSNGKFRCAALLNFASEVSCFGDAPLWDNKHRSVKSVGMAIIGNMAAADAMWGEGVIQSDFQELPTAADGNMSNICHHLGQAHVMRNADFHLQVVGITMGPQTIVQIAAGTLEPVGLVDGNQIYVTAGDTPELAYRVFTVANIDVENDTFELQGEDSTGYTPYTGGATIQNRTGPALLAAGAKAVTCLSGYLLTYGSPAIVLDLENGGDISDWDFNFQPERDVDRIVEFIADGATETIKNFRFRAYNYSQVSENSVWSVTGSGVVRVDGGCLIISNMPEAPSSSVLDQEDQFILYNFDIEVPRAAALPDRAAIGPSGNQHTGKMTAYDRYPQSETFGGLLTDVAAMQFGMGGAALPGPGIRAVFPAGHLHAYRPHDGAEVPMIIPIETTLAELGSAASAINTTNKIRGIVAYDETGAWYMANGGTATAGWRSVAAGGPTIIPS